MLRVVNWNFKIYRRKYIVLTGDVLQHPKLGNRNIYTSQIIDISVEDNFLRVTTQDGEYKCLYYDFCINNGVVMKLAHIDRTEVMKTNTESIIFYYDICSIISEIYAEQNYSISSVEYINKVIKSKLNNLYEKYETEKFIEKIISSLLEYEEKIDIDEKEEIIFLNNNIEFYSSKMIYKINDKIHRGIINVHLGMFHDSVVIGDYSLFIHSYFPEENYKVRFYKWKSSLDKIYIYNEGNAMLHMKLKGNEYKIKPEEKLEINMT